MECQWDSFTWTWIVMLVHCKELLLSSPPCAAPRTLFPLEKVDGGRNSRHGAARMSERSLVENRAGCARVCGTQGWERDSVRARGGPGLRGKCALFTGNKLPSQAVPLCVLHSPSA
uniref:Uncharacterized protein n=1 Tax=Sphaerodactylus townsendi TaxID=933632 RepID=A0ACB8FZN1_9SAUR